MAIDLARPEELIDPFGGQADLEQGVLRTLHPGSFRDDPTRALRGARYASRMNLTLAPEASEQLAGLDLETVSAERLASELGLSATEECGCGALTTAIDWGLFPAPAGDQGLLTRICEVIALPTWRSYLSSIGSGARVILVDAVNPTSAGDSRALTAAAGLLDTHPASGSEVTSLASRRSPSEIVIARAMGAEWLDRWCEDLRSVRLSISGDDLIAEGIPPGPLIGIGLTAALNSKLDGAVDGRLDEMQVALEACRSAEGRSL
jgi:tRNA nucleotidyltransferase (CCA-adding enzyme)